MAWKNADPSSLSPIVKLPEGQPIVCQITRIRKNLGKDSSSLVDCLSPNGNIFCLPGHAALVSKVTLFEPKLPAWCLVEFIGLKHPGTKQEYNDYRVTLWDGSLEELARDPEAQTHWERADELADARRQNTPF